MRGSRLGILLAVMVWSCSHPNIDRALDSLAPSQQAVSNPNPDIFGHTPPHIRAKPQEYVDCIRHKQALPDYAPLVGKLLFTKAPTSKTAIKNTNANAAEQLNILRWELERKDCVLVMDAYLEYFSNTDTTVAKRFTKLQGQIRDAHTDLSHERITYTIAIQRILDADRVFWRSASSKHRDMAIILNQSWIDEIPTQ